MDALNIFLKLIFFSNFFFFIFISRANNFSNVNIKLYNWNVIYCFSSTRVVVL